MQSDILRFFHEGLTQFYANSNISSALENYNWIISEIDADQCDVYLAKAALDPNSVSDDLVRETYRTLRTYGDLIKELDIEPGKLRSKYRLKFTNTDQNFGTRSDIRAAYAMVLLDEGKPAEAVQVLQQAEPRTPRIDMSLGIAFMYAGRWEEVIAAVQPCLDAKYRDQVTERMDASRPDQYIQRMGSLLLGIAYAHLGNAEVALGHLNAACESVIDTNTGQTRGGFRMVIAEAMYWAGLVERSRGNEDEAQKLFNRGVHSQQTDALMHAVSDTSVKIKITSPEMIGQRSDYWDQSTEPDLEEVAQEHQAEARVTLLEDAQYALDRQIGMKNVKAQVTRLKSTIAVTKERESRGGKFARKSLHLIFTGPPGTGKTTVARIVSQIYAGLGVIEKPEIVETSRNDFVGMYQGHSTNKTVETVNRALGGILFIDEAYNLVTSKDGGGTDTFGVEAVGELLRLMENHRDNLIVIIAGYANDIDRFLDTNEGLSSRFTNRIDFTSYSPEEITQIANLVAHDRNSVLSPDAEQLVTDTATILMDSDHTNTKKLIDKAGNGRFCRNLVEIAEGFKDDRLFSSGMDLSSMSNDQLATITYQDVKNAVDQLVSPIIYGEPTS